MKDLLIQSGFVYVRHVQSQCCSYDIYHKTVDNKLCEVWLGTNKHKFKFVWNGRSDYHTPNANAPLAGQLEYRLKDAGLLNTVAQ